MNSLFQKIGGSEAVHAAVDIFYRKVLTHQDIAHFFDDVDMDQQILKQKGFLTFAFGGPHQYTGKSMREGHAHLLSKGLNNSHVDVVVGLLIETLQELQVPKAQIDEVAAIANSVRDEVLGR